MIRIDLKLSDNMFHPSLKKKLYAAYWGFIVGDALGVPYEFCSREMMESRPATDMVGYGSHKQPAGTWSDDSSMMLCVLENMKQNGSTRELSNLFLQWYQSGYHTPHGEVFDIGLTTRASMIRLSEGVSPFNSGSSDQWSAGNGSLMRCVPYAFAEDISRSIFNMIIHNKITHREALCHEACMFYLKMIRSLAEGAIKEESLAKAGAYLKYGWRIVDQEDYNESSEKFYRLLRPDFSMLSIGEIKSSGYVLDTLEASIWCFMNSSSYKDAVLKAVNLGGDTDTIGALTGSLAATYYGVEGIPETWKLKIVRSKKLDRLIHSCIS
jgi:ADP-ribosylglycohydrolase